jgi:tripartite-type tricarboxylate transporter receptor subunit TctC
VIITRRKLPFLAGAAAALASGSARPARAAGWPNRPLEMIVAFAPGGGTDVAARTVARLLEPRLGQPVVVVNRPGAGGEIGYAALARARKDGLTIGFINAPTILTMPMERRTQYAMADLAPIANVVDDPGGVFVNAKSPHANLKALLAAARARPGALTYGTTGVGSDDHIAILSLERATGVRLTHVPYSGSSAVRQAVVAGDVDIGALNMGEGAPDLRQGLMRCLGQMARERWSGAAEIPTMREQGIDLVEGALRGLAAPAGTPPEVMRVLSDAVGEVMKDPEFIRLADEQLLPLRYLDAVAFTNELKAQNERYGELWKVLPWREA